MKITFLGATRTVTGSKYLLEVGKKRYLIDCGLFQGFKELRLRNWEPLPIPPGTIDAIVLTHAHIDHTGYLPRIVKEGFTGKIYCTPATHDLCKIMLKDSARLQEEDALRANRKHYTKHRPALPLYTEEDAEHALKHFRTVPFGQTFSLQNQLHFTYHHAGHILGASFITVEAEGVTITFSGDLGRLHDAVLRAPETPPKTDYLVLESTYGNRLHEKVDPQSEIEKIVNETMVKRGKLLIPAFAVGRAQSVLYYINQLQKSGKIPRVPIYMDSPMATSATKIFCNYADELRISEPVCEDVCESVTYIRNVEESKKLNGLKGEAIIISASGMATGGRVLHHLKQILPHRENTVLFSGFQAGGTRGDRLVSGEKEIKIHGKMIPVHARIENINNISAHADYQEIFEWLEHFSTPPKKVFITHGEEEAAESLATKIREQKKWEAIVPDYLHTEILD